jgi:hypothetical protein
MAKARLAYTNLLTAPGVTISSSGEATGYVDDNLASPARWKKWRSTTTTGDQWWKADLGANKNFQVLAAMNAVLHTGGTLKAQANASDSWGAPTISDTFSVPSPDFTQVLADWLSAVQSLRWIRFYFTNVGAVSGFVELGAVFAGTYLEPVRGVSDGVALRRVDPSIQRFAIGGQRSSVVRPKFHQISAAFQFQTQSARDDLRALYETTGSTIPALIGIDASDTSLNFYGTVQSPLAPQDRGPNLWDVPIEFTEDVP